MAPTSNHSGAVTPTRGVPGTGQARPQLRGELAIAGLIIVALLAAVGSSFGDAEPTTIVPAVGSILEIESGFEREGAGNIVRIFGFDPPVAREVLRPVTKRRPLPADYRTPGDLAPISTFGVSGPEPVRAIAGEDLAAMNRAASRRLVSESAYRSIAEQRALFNDCLAPELAAGGTRAEAEARANQTCAFPGQSQHHLGTAIDFRVVDERGNGNGLGPWLAQHGWEHGFVMSYTVKAAARTGYGHEPWHYRWVGKPLARFLMERRYIDGELAVDDYLEAIWESAEFE